MDTVEVAAALMDRLSKTYPKNIAERYKLTLTEESSGLSLLSAGGKKRGCLVSGGEIDYNRIAAIVLDEFRGGKIGRITLEKPEDPVKKEDEGSLNG